MVAASRALRIMVLTRGINICERQLANLNDEKNYKTAMRSSVQQKYNTAYNALQYGSLTDEQQYGYYEQVKDLEPLLYALTEDENQNQTQSNTIQTIMKAMQLELDELRKADSEMNKRETAKLLGS